LADRGRCRYSPRDELCATYVGGYQGAPASHLLDVMIQARDYPGELTAFLASPPGLV
jgi:hypothetical protein